MEQPEETLLNAEDKQRYQAITGSVLYLAQITRYDIMYSTSQLARAMSTPAKIHMGAAKPLLRYLSGTKNFSITYKKGGLRLTAFSNSNWGNNPDSGKSMLSYILIDELQVGTSKPHCHVDHEGRAHCCGTGDEGGDILHQHDDGAGIRI